MAAGVSCSSVLFQIKVVLSIQRFSLSLDKDFDIISKYSK